MRHKICLCDIATKLTNRFEQWEGSDFNKPKLKTDLSYVSD